MTQEKERNRIFLIPEGSYDERAENLATMYWMLKMIINMARTTGNLALNDKGVKRSFKWLLKRCDKFDAFADQILDAESIPPRYVESKDRAELEAKKAKEIFVDGLLDDDCEDDEADCLIEDDDYDDVYDAGFFFDGEGEDVLSYNDVECMEDEVYVLREDATQCVVGASEIIKSADELLESLAEIKRRIEE